MAWIAIPRYSQAVAGALNLSEDLIVSAVESAIAPPGNDDLGSPLQRLSDIPIIFRSDWIGHPGQYAWIWRTQSKEVHYLYPAKTEAVRKTENASQRRIVNTAICSAWIQ